MESTAPHGNEAHALATETAVADVIGACVIYTIAPDGSTSKKVTFDMRNGLVREGTLFTICAKRTEPLHVSDRRTYTIIVVCERCAKKHDASVSGVGCHAITLALRCYHQPSHARLDDISITFTPADEPDTLPVQRMCHA
jgi:hypothetical protein